MNKKAILYVRVSTDEQAEKGYSLAHQEEKLRQYCAMQNIQIVGFYKEDHSAQTFERPEFTKLLAFSKKSKNAVNLLLFTKWDRFSRNAGDAYGMINQLNKLGIEPQALEQPLDLTIPENKIMLAFYLAAPEVENDRRSLNIISGMRRAKKEGRYLGPAPVGYKNVRDEKGKGQIIIDESQAPIVKWAFEEIAKGIHSVHAIWEMAKEKGLKSGRTHFWVVIKNPLYCGLIEIPAYKDEESLIVNGTHEPIISKELFEQVQFVLFGRKKNSPLRQTKKEELPLRGFLLCPKCNNKLTGSASKGCKGGKYFYYHCTSKCGVRFKAESLNLKLIENFKSITLNKKALNYIYEGAKNTFKLNQVDFTSEKKNIETEIKKYSDRISNARRLMLDGEIESSDYKEIKEEYEPKIHELSQKIKDYQSADLNLNEYLEFYFSLAKTLDRHYLQMDLEGKQQLISSMYPQNIVFEKENSRTNEMNYAIGLLHNTDVRFKKIKNGQEAKICNLSALVAETRLELVTFGL